MRNTLLGLALAATVVASVVDFPATETVEPREAGRAAAARPSPLRAAAPVPEPAFAPRAPFGPAAADLFAARNWQPAPAAPASAAGPAPTPVAPPLPFRYLGKLLSPEGVLVFLGRDTRTFMLRKGDVVADYQVVDITPAGMSLLYLPLNEQQQLAFGSSH